ncbi:MULTISPECIES: hypothetical protein [Flavobacterium]|uniref:Yip1 domain-containing protein n=1 Tax=Flavobacterium keumense TaxID=1306518 RepID=A0ABY8N4I6_9FLAO|nr:MULTISPECIES: hypothetical protein [Flavobacterium]WGK94554.1 hypothetical protein MG292_10795 [Flavobacterium keumense]
MSEQLTSKQVKEYLEFQDKWQWISYFMVPILVLIKTVFITSALYIGVFIFNKSTTTFKKLWEIVINSEFIFLLVPICKIIWFYFFQTEYKLIDIQYFYPLSALNIISYKGLEPWLIYPLQTLNLFELAYVVYLSYQIGNLTKTNADSGLKIVASSYIPALFLWVTIVMFFTLNFS